MEKTEQKQVNCPLCSIPNREPVIYEDDLIYLVSTLDQRGHKVRVMAATKRHVAVPSFEEQVKADAVLTDYMNNTMGSQDWYIVSGEHASVPEHYHRMACDFPLEEEEDPFFACTSKIHFPLKERKILIGIPAFNEEAHIESVVKEAVKYGKVVVVNDCSFDSTAQKAKVADAEVVTHQVRRGYGASIRDLFAVAKAGNFDVLVTLDGDGQHDPSEIDRFVKETKIADVVTGNRFLCRSEAPKYRKLGIKTISKLNGLGDAQCGFRAYNKHAIQVLADKIFEVGMGASVEILKVAKSYNLQINEVPCNINYGCGEHSQNPFSHGADVVRAFFWSIIWEKPSRTLLPLAVLLSAFALASAIQTINLYVQFHEVVLSWALFFTVSTICALLMFNALTFIFVEKNKKVN